MSRGLHSDVGFVDDAVACDFIRDRPSVLTMSSSALILELVHLTEPRHGRSDRYYQLRNERIADVSIEIDRRMPRP